MEKSRFPRGYKVYLPLVLLFALLVFVMPRSPKFNYDYRKGSVWMYEDLVSQFDFPLLKSEEQYKAELQKVGASVVPVYRQDPAVLEAAYLQLSSSDMGKYNAVKPHINASLGRIYSKGVLPRNAVVEPAGVMYIQKDVRASKVPFSEVYTMESASSALRQSLSSEISETVADSLFNAALVGLVNSDLVFDQQLTDLIHEENVALVSPTMGVIKAGQTIVSQGELITEEVEQMLDSYKAEYEANVGYAGPPVLQWVGNSLVALFLVLVLFFAIYFCNYHIFETYNKYLYVLLVFAISAIASFVVAQTEPRFFYMVPYTLIALYLLAFFTRRLVFTVYFISLLPMLIVAPEGIELFFIYLCGGVVVIYVFDYFNRGWLQFVSALITFAVMALVWVSFRLVGGVDTFTTLRPLGHLALAAFLSVAGYPLIYLFEKMFMLVSSSKLVELSDTSRPLLRMLADKAPGTFQHSLQVMNLSDAVARSIDANIPLIRAAALYHDIGKIANPQCFTENETPGVRYHEGLSPKESAQEIIRHVGDGLALADKYGVPGVLKDFIRTHHGTTCTAYFMTQYLNAGGDPAETEEFYYNGVKPVTREQVILMLCDAVEAASRSLKDYSEQSISALVDKIVDGKADDGQLSDSDISLREVTRIKEVMKSYLQQMYHSRVSYPKRESKA
jgi:putative nucleotidyltransferase with HDIG domain